MPRTCRRWTAAEDDVLLTHYFARGQRWCADLLGRTPGSVGGRAVYLGLRRQRHSPASGDHRMIELRAPRVLLYAERAAQHLPLFSCSLKGI